MNPLEKLKNEALSGGRAKEIDRVVNSEQGKRIGKMVDGAALKNAVNSGDSATINQIVSQFLSTNEGKALVKQINESFGK